MADFLEVDVLNKGKMYINVDDISSIRKSNNISGKKGCRIILKSAHWHSDWIEGEEKEEIVCSVLKYLNAEAFSKIAIKDFK